MRVMLTGGAGYMGSRLVPALLDDGHDVVVYDTFWFGDHLPETPLYDARDKRRGRIFKYVGDIRDAGALRRTFAMFGPIEAVIHLACLSNDPSSEIDAGLTRAINLDAFVPLVTIAANVGVRRFIYCSTSSVYGISDAPEVCEDHPHVPITLYNTYKSQCEELLWRNAGGMECVILRPSTHCGYSPRQRLDLAVNILTTQAFARGTITVLGGAQRRPNIHIDDMVDCYRLILTAPAADVAGEVFNVGAGNTTILELAELVRDVAADFAVRKVAIEIRGSIDPRSYQVCSRKIEHKLGFRPRRKVADAIRDLWTALADGRLPDPLDRSVYYNVRRMREIVA